MRSPIVASGRFPCKCGSFRDGLAVCWNAGGRMNARPVMPEISHGISSNPAQSRVCYRRGDDLGVCQRSRTDHDTKRARPGLRHHRCRAVAADHRRVRPSRALRCAPSMRSSGARAPSGFDQPQEAAEFFKRQRVLHDEDELPVEHLLAERDKLRARETRLGGLRTSDPGPGGIYGWYWIGPRQHRRPHTRDRVRPLESRHDVRGRRDRRDLEEH